MKKALWIGAGVVALGLSTAALAHGGGDRGEKMWDRLDANGDGAITQEELNARHGDLIEKADADGDGAVTKEEMRAFRDAKRAEWREKRNPDKNDDGVVDRTEFLNAAQERFDRMDKNGDGVLQEDEMRRGRGHHRGGRHGGDKD